MVLLDENGQQIPGDAITYAALRHDCAPVPVTLEAVIRLKDDALAEMLQEGKKITTGSGDVVRIIFSKPAVSSVVQDSSMQHAVKIIAFLEACCNAAFVRERPIIKSSTSLQAIYRACGCPLAGVKDDVSIARFVCIAGDTPTFHIARAIQEAGGIVRWDGERLEFSRLRDVLDQEPILSLPDKASENVKSGFLERHEAPFFFSTAPDGSIVQGNRAKARSVMFAPRQNVQELYNMTRVMLRTKVCKTDYDMRIKGGDVIQFIGAENHAVLTAVHYWASGTEGGAGIQTYTKLWCGRPSL